MEVKLIGKMSTFGGPDDTGVSSSEGLALINDSNFPLVKEYFLDDQPTGTSGLARRLDPDKAYIACRWNYDETSKNFLIKTLVEVRNPTNGKTEMAKPIDYGPNLSTGRTSDLSPGLAKRLNLNTNDIVEVTVKLSIENAPNGDHGTSEPFKKPKVNFIQSPNHSARDGVKISQIILHYTDSPTAQSAINTFLDDDTENRVSAHYIIDKNGDIYQMVSDGDKAWHTRGANADSIGIEHVALENQKLTTLQEKSSVSLIKWLLSEYKLSINRISGHRYSKDYADGIGGTDCPHSLFGSESEASVKEWVNRHFS
jgi:hypothetical protein